MIRVSIGLFVAFLLIGCAPAERLPSYRWVDGRTTLRDLAARAQQVRTASAQCDLVLTRLNGQSVRLDGALAMQPPDRVRLRAWKLGQAVFDLTLTPDGLWVVMPTDESGRERVLPASLSAGKMARAWALLSGQFFSGDDLRVIDTGGPRFRVERPIEGQRVTCEIDRATLTPRVYTLTDASGARRLTLSQDRYQVINGIAWPTRLTARSDSGTIEVQMSNVELNGELAPNAFVPPRRAERLP